MKRDLIMKLTVKILGLFFTCITLGGCVKIYIETKQAPNPIEQTNMVPVYGCPIPYPIEQTNMVPNGSLSIQPGTATQTIKTVEGEFN